MISTKSFLALGLVLSGLGIQSMAGEAVRDAGVETTNPNARLVAYINNPEGYPGALRAAIRGYPIAWGRSVVPDVLVVPVNASEQQAAEALRANQEEGIPLVIYKGDLTPSPGFLKTFMAVSSSYAAVVKGGQSRHFYEYSLEQLQRFSREIDAKLAARPQRTGSVSLDDDTSGQRTDNFSLSSGTTTPTTGDPIVSNPVVNGQHLQQVREDFEYKVDTDGSGNYYADIVLQITGTRNIDAQKGQQVVYWTASVQGSGFSGKPLYSEDYEPGYQGDADSSMWFVTVPLHYTVSLAVSKGTGHAAPIVETYSPSNQSITSDYTVTTGWNVSANGSMTTSSQGGGVSAGITDSESRKLTIKDATLTTTTDLSKQQYTWDLEYTSFNSYPFKKYGATAFISSSLSAADSNMLLNNFSDLAPTMQAYAPMYNVQYETAAADFQRKHGLTLTISEQQWRFYVEREHATWGAADQGGDTYPGSSVQEAILFSNSF